MDSHAKAASCNWVATSCAALVASSSVRISQIWRDMRTAMPFDGTRWPSRGISYSFGRGPLGPCFRGYCAGRKQSGHDPNQTLSDAVLHAMTCASYELTLRNSTVSMQPARRRHALRPVQSSNPASLSKPKTCALNAAVVVLAVSVTARLSSRSVGPARTGRTRRWAGAVEIRHRTGRGRQCRCRPFRPERGGRRTARRPRNNRPRAPS